MINLFFKFIIFFMKKFLKITALILVILAVGIFIFGYSNSEPLPKGEKNEQADVLAKKMLTALNKDAFDDLKIIEWTFKGIHSYKWYKQENKVEVTWDTNKVILFTTETQKSIVYVDGKETENTEILNKAIGYFNNDSFWLVAPYKVLDSGTERSIVKHNEKDALLITYTSGGSTPGDSYLWILDDNYLPISYKMWVSIIPIGGLEATWENWITTDSGAKLPTNHTLTLIDMEVNMGTVKASN